MPIYKQFHKFVIGKGGQNIRKIRDETETRIDLPDSGSDSDMITITGRKEKVALAQERIQKIQSEMADLVSKDIMVPAKIHNMMIGAGGKLIQSIMSECGGASYRPLLLLSLPPPFNLNNRCSFLVSRAWLCFGP